MPSQVAQAVFMPIAPDFDLETLVEDTPSFQYVPRISYNTLRERDTEEFEKLIIVHVIIGGKPLVIEDFHEHLPAHLFSASWLAQNEGSKRE